MSEPPPLELVYSCRPSLLEKENRWVLWVDSLERSTTEFHDATPLTEVADIRLQYAPTRFCEQMFCCRIRLRNGKVWHLQNQHFSGIANFENRSEAYKDFIENLVLRVASQQPQFVLITGTSWANWLLSSLFLFISLLLMLVVMFYLWTVIGWLVIVKLLVILFCLPRACRWISRNRPKTIDPQNIPAELLPK
jgi:hypothetical protein